MQSKKKKSINSIKRKIIPILKRNDIVKAGIFGSYAKGESKRGSDIDILVDIKKEISLLDFIGIKLELEEVLKKKVDLVEYSTIKPLIRERILHEQVEIL